MAFPLSHEEIKKTVGDPENAIQGRVNELGTSPIFLPRRKA